MTKLAYRTLSNRMVGKLEVEKDTVFWDRELTGFGVRVYPTGAKVYIAQARGPEGPKRVTVGRHGVIHGKQARQRAALIISRVKAGEAPVPEPIKPAGGPTVAELAKRYLEEYVEVRCKPRTVKVVRSVVRKHIAPALGRLPLAAVERAHVAELHQRLCGTPAAANQAVRTLSLMYRLACDWGMVPEGMNPCRSIDKYPGRRRERFLTAAEFGRLGCVLDEAETRGGATAPAVAAIRLLMLTGCRKSEILTLRWEDVALGESELKLPDTKTGARVVSLSPPAVKLLAGPRAFPATPGSSPARSRGRTCENSMTPGRPSARARGSMTSGSMTCVILVQHTGISRCSKVSYLIVITYFSHQHRNPPDYAFPHYVIVSQPDLINMQA